MVEVVVVWLGIDNVFDLVKDYDFIFDCMDNFIICYLVFDVVEIIGILLVWGMIL